MSTSTEDIIKLLDALVVDRDYFSDLSSQKEEERNKLNLKLSLLEEKLKKELGIDEKIVSDNDFRLYINAIGKLKSDLFSSQSNLKIKSVKYDDLVEKVNGLASLFGRPERKYKSEDQLHFLFEEYKRNLELIGGQRVDIPDERQLCLDFTKDISVTPKINSVSPLNHDIPPKIDSFFLTGDSGNNSQNEDLNTGSNDITPKYEQFVSSRFSSYRKYIITGVGVVVIAGLAMLGLENYSSNGLNKNGSKKGGSLAVVEHQLDAVSDSSFTSSFDLSLYVSSGPYSDELPDHTSESLVYSSTGKVDDVALDVLKEDKMVSSSLDIITMGKTLFEEKHAADSHDIDSSDVDSSSDITPTMKDLAADLEDSFSGKKTLLVNKPPLLSFDDCGTKISYTNRKKAKCTYSVIDEGLLEKCVVKYVVKMSDFNGNSSKDIPIKSKNLYNGSITPNDFCEKKGYPCMIDLEIDCYNTRGQQGNNLEKRIVIEPEVIKAEKSLDQSCGSKHTLKNFVSPADWSKWFCQDEKEVSKYCIPREEYTDRTIAADNNIYFGCPKKRQLCCQPPKLEDK